MKVKSSKLQKSTNSRRSAHLKNWLSTKIVSNIKLKHKKHPSRLYFFAYFFALVAIAYIFYLRFPNNFQEPNFYAEDGYIFTDTLIENGFLKAAFTTFNGYFISGLYVLFQASQLLNKLFYGGEFVNLAKSIALVSYAFLGFIATLPILLFKNYIRPLSLLFITLLLTFTPMIGSDYAVIGVIGNFKFGFIFIAFLLLIYRYLLPVKSKQFFIVDIALLLCAYTNVTVYALMPFAFLRYLPQLKDKRGLFTRLVRDTSFISLILTCLLLLPQLYIVKSHGIPELPGYLDTPYDAARTVEIFAYRSYLYTVLFPIGKYLNDTIAIALLGLFICLGTYFSGKYRKFFVFGVFTIFITTLLFVINRTGISDHFFGYKSGGPDQFFYPQNWIFGFILALTVSELLGKIRKRTIRIKLYIILYGLVVFTLAPHSSTYGQNKFMGNGVGNIYKLSQVLCASNKPNLNLTIYPTRELVYRDIAREGLCTKSVASYKPLTIDFDLYSGGAYVDNLGVSNQFLQTFVSPENNLDGIVIYFSTFNQEVRTSYELTLYDKECKKIIRSADIPISKLKDNVFFTVHFPVIPDSTNKTYCFTVESTANGEISPLAIQLSEPDVYLDGATKINQTDSDRDVVFQLHYKR